MSKAKSDDDFEYEPLPPLSTPQVWVSPEKAAVLRKLPVEELQEIRERAMVKIAEGLETVALKAVAKIEYLMEHGEKEEIQLKAADRALSFFDKQGPQVAVQINNRPQFQSHLGLPAAPPMPADAKVVLPERPPLASDKPPVIVEGWTRDEPKAP